MLRAKGGRKTRRPPPAVELTFPSFFCIFPLSQLQLDPDVLPPSPTVDDLTPMLPQLPRSQFPLIAHTLLLSSIFPPKHDASFQTAAAASDSSPNSIAYTSTSRANVFQTLNLLGIDPAEIVVRQEEKVAAELFELLKKSAEADEGKNAMEKDKEGVERARKAKEDGWGGKWGRWAATGAGVVVGSSLSFSRRVLPLDKLGL